MRLAVITLVLGVAVYAQNLKLSTAEAVLGLEPATDRAPRPQLQNATVAACQNNSASSKLKKLKGYSIAKY